MDWDKAREISGMGINIPAIPSFSSPYFGGPRLTQSQQLLYTAHREEADKLGGKISKLDIKRGKQGLTVKMGERLTGYIRRYQVICEEIALLCSQIGVDYMAPGPGDWGLVGRGYLEWER